jgi:transcriptional regulator with XRE-family HTH domain
VGLASQRTPAQVELGRRVRERRRDLGLSQMALADRIGLHFTFVSTVERGERNLSLASLLAIADGLGMDLSELVADLRHSGAAE